MLHRAPLALMGIFVAASVGALALRAHVRAGGGGPGLPSQPVMVVVVKSAADVDKVREAIDDERIVASTGEGFAVREGRIVVAGVEAAGPLLSQAGWTEAKLEIVKVGARGAGPSDGGAAPRPGLEGLYGKSTLTLDEALRALQSLE